MKTINYLAKKEKKKKKTLQRCNLDWFSFAHFFFYCDIAGAKFSLQSFIITLGLYLLIIGKTTEHKSSYVLNLRVIPCGFLTFDSFRWGLCPPVLDIELPPNDAGGFKLLGRDFLPI